MDADLANDSFGMPRGSLLRIDDGIGTLLHVWEGELWLTQAGSRTDHLLKAGQSFCIDRDGAALAYAFGRSLVSLSSSGARAAPRRVTLIPVRQPRQPERGVDVGLVMPA